MRVSYCECRFDSSSSPCRGSGMGFQNPPRRKGTHPAQVPDGQIANGGREGVPLVETARSVRGRGGSHSNNASPKPRIAASPAIATLLQASACVSSWSA